MFASYQTPMYPPHYTCTSCLRCDVSAGDNRVLLSVTRNFFAKPTEHIRTTNASYRKYFNTTLCIVLCFSVKLNASDVIGFYSKVKQRHKQPTRTVDKVGGVKTCLLG